MSSCFDGAPIVFTVFMLLYEHFGISRKTIFTCYLVVPLTMLAISWLWPNKSIEYLIEEAKKEDAKPSEETDPEVTKGVETTVHSADTIVVDLQASTLSSSSAEAEKEAVDVKEMKPFDDDQLDIHELNPYTMEEHQSEVVTVVESPDPLAEVSPPVAATESAPIVLESARQQVLTLEWVLTAAYFGLTCLQLNFFLGTIDLQLIGIDPDPDHHNGLFSASLSPLIFLS